MKERVLITGASGFIGYHVIEAALAAGFEVFAAVRRLSKVVHLSYFPIQYVYPDFDNIADLEQDITNNKYDYIIHAAGVTSALSADEYHYYNTTYTANLAKAAADKIKKFVFISSLAAIGPLKDISGIITEDSPKRPVTQYGESKLAAENELAKIAGLNYVVLRPTAVYGPRERGIFIMFKQLTRGIELYIGKKEQRFSFIYCKDLANAVIKSLKKGSGAYNLSDGNVYGRYELTDITKDILNLRTLKFSLPVKLVNLIALAADKIGQLTKKPSPLNRDKLNELTAVSWNCTIDKAVDDLGFAPRYDLRTGLEETLHWYKKEKWL